MTTTKTTDLRGALEALADKFDMAGSNASYNGTEFEMDTWLEVATLIRTTIAAHPDNSVTEWGWTSEGERRLCLDRKTAQRKVDYYGGVVVSRRAAGPWEREA